MGSWLMVFDSVRDALDGLGLKRYCCRRMVLTHVDLIEKLLHCKSNNQRQSFTLTRTTTL